MHFSNFQGSAKGILNIHLLLLLLLRLYPRWGPAFTNCMLTRINFSLNILFSYRVMPEILFSKYLLRFLQYISLISSSISSNLAVSFSSVLPACLKLCILAYIILQSLISQQRQLQHLCHYPCVFLVIIHIPALFFHNQHYDNSSHNSCVYLQFVSHWHLPIQHHKVNLIHFEL